MKTRKVVAHPVEGQDFPPACFVGPPLQEGPLPAVFFFLSTAHESLTAPPVNQPVVALTDFPLRIFSVDVPGHGFSTDPSDAIEKWAEWVAAGKNFVETFTQSCRQLLDVLITEEAIDPLRIGVAGVSRGAFMATHLAAVEPRVDTILGFAPLTQPAWQPKFQGLRDYPLTQALALENLCPQLIHRRLRFYMGNRDEKVGTKNAFQFIQRLTEAAFDAKIRSPQVELYIVPSIGHKGHGTSQETFNSGAKWLAKQLLK